MEDFKMNTVTKGLRTEHNDISGPVLICYSYHSWRSQEKMDPYCY